MYMDIDHFEQFRRPRKDNRGARSKDEETVSLLISSFGNDAFSCCNKFIEQGIEYKDLASLSREDLILFGVSDQNVQTDMLETFAQLSKQDFSLDEVKKSAEAEMYNSQIMNRATSYLDTMKMSLTGTNLKLRLKPCRDMVLDERNFASKFVLDALNELSNVTSDIEKELDNLENICTYGQKKSGKSRLNIKYLALGSLMILCTSLAVWKLR